MIFYITSLAFREIIHRTVTELDLICAGNECSNEMYLLKYVRENLSRMNNLDQVIVDLNALQDTDAEIIQAFEMLRIMNYTTKIIVLASNRQPGDELLKNCFAMGIYDMILSNVFAEIYEELKCCLTVGKQYKDAMRYKEGNTEQSVVVKKELKRTVNKILIGIAGVQPRIGCTHLGIVLAGYLRKKGYVAALLEYDNSIDTDETVGGTFESIREAYGEVLTGDGYFSLGGVDYYAHTGSKELLQLLSGKFYNFIIVDFGLYQECDKLMYSKCDIRLLVTGAKPWETVHVTELFAQGAPDELQQMNYVFNFAAASDREDIRKSLSGITDKIYFLPLSDSPFDSPEIGDMEKIFTLYDEQAPPENKKHGFLGFPGRRKSNGKKNRYKA